MFKKARAVERPPHPEVVEMVSGWVLDQCGLRATKATEDGQLSGCMVSRITATILVPVTFECVPSHGKGTLQMGLIQGP